MKHNKSYIEKLILCILFISLIALAICLYLLVTSNSNSTQEFKATFNLYEEWKIEEEEIEAIKNDYYTNDSIGFMDPESENGIQTTLPELDNANDVEDNIKYIYDEFWEITLESKHKLKENYGEQISEIDSVYKYYSTGMIIKDIIPWNNFYNNIELKSEYLHSDNFVPKINVSCTPYSYGYTDKMAAELFKPRKLTECKENSNIIETTSSYIKIQCEESIGNYIIGGRGNYQKLGKRSLTYKWSEINNNQIDFNNKEFIIVKCRKTQKQAFRVLHFSQEASNRSKNITLKIESLLKISKNKPIGIYIIMLDSVSRKHFYRNLPNTIHYLNSKTLQSNSSLVVYDFLINNAHDFHTTANIIPFLFGKTVETHESITNNLKRTNPSDNNAYKYIQESSLWKFYERLGYVTAFDWDTIKDNFNNHIGRKVYADHTPLDFWSAAAKVFKYDDFTARQNCFGEKRHQYFVLDYLNQFNRKYSGHNRFGYFHISVGHEWSGFYIKTLDKDFIPFFDEFFNYYDNADEDFVLLISGDHGRSIWEWDTYLEGFMESELPIQLIITNKELISKFGKETHENLLHNTKRLVSRGDWHVTLKHLALIPYGNIDISSDTYENFKSESISNNSLSLFLEKIPDNRLCDDVKIPKSYCSCRNYENITSEVIKYESLNLLNKTIEEINLSFIMKDNTCNNIDIKEIISIESFLLRDALKYSIQIKIIYTLANFPNIRIQFIIYLAEENVFNYILKRKKVEAPIRNFETEIEGNIYKLKMSVFSVEILNEHICNYTNKLIDIASQ